MSETTADAVYRILGHPVFLSAFFSWFIAQFLKSIIEIIKRKSRSMKVIIKTTFWTTGGMPSSHSSVAAAIATSIGFTEGVNSSLFAAVLFYGVLTVRDALGVRRSAGTQAQTLNKLGKEMQEKYGIQFKPVKEINGHTPSEVTVGMLLGFFIAVAFCTL